MRSDLLHVVTCIFNPFQWKSRIAHYKKFRDHMIASGVNLTVVECAYGDRPFELVNEPDGVNVVQVKSRSLAWNKESLINLAVSRLPHDAQYIAWIDADVIFRSPTWAADTVHALQHYAVVQVWSHALDLGPKGLPMVIQGRSIQTSFGKVWHDLEDIDSWVKNAGNYSYPHPGYGWAMTRKLFDDLGGLIEESGLGAADHMVATACVGLVHTSIHGGMTDSFKKIITTWGDRAHALVKGNLGYVDGLIEHLFHGAKHKRKYVEKWDILVDHKFDPITDLKRNSYGVLELAGNKPAMERAFRRHFLERDEDANTLHE